MKATWKNLKPGTRVRCIFKKWYSNILYHWYGKSARVINTTCCTIMVAWDDGDKRDTIWSEPSSFEIIEDNQFPYIPTEYEMNHGGVPLTN